jgi:hypothetical protein
MAERPAPSFEEFTRWVAALGRKASAGDPPAAVLAAARDAREHSLVADQVSSGRLEVIELLAAASDDVGLPTELITARGFRVSIVYGEAAGQKDTSLCILVQCPTELAAQLFGRTAYLWNSQQRFEIGQFDADGRAIGTLPAGIEITTSDLARGAVQLEEPDSPSDDD